MRHLSAVLFFAFSSVTSVFADTTLVLPVYDCIGDDFGEVGSTVKRVFIGDEEKAVTLKQGMHNARSITLKKFAVVELTDTAGQVVDWYVLSPNQFTTKPTDPSEGEGVRFFDLKARETYICGVETQMEACPAKTISN